MAKTPLLFLMKIILILIFVVWIAFWFLKPTNLWTQKWKDIEENFQTTVFKYNGADFLVYTLPIIVLSMVGTIYLQFQSKRSIRSGVRSYTTALWNPLIIKTPLGTLSVIEVLGMVLFITLLVWTFYTKISNDFKKLIPAKGLKLRIWQLKLLKVATRFGLLAEVCLGFLLLPILRGLSILKLLGIQFEASVRYHIWIGTMMIFCAALHGIGTLFIWSSSHQIQNQVWRWQKQGRIYLAGEITLITGLIIWISSLPFVRRKRFDLFYYMHHLYTIFILFFLFHVGDRHFYMVFGGVLLFALDKLLRVIQSNPNTQILSVRVFPGRVIELTLPKDPGLNYTPTSIIFLRIPIISKYRWHPFSITSSSKVNDKGISVLIKCEGRWTNSLYDLLNPVLNLPCRSKCIPVSVEGPYGPSSFEFSRYGHLVLIAGGIGITPILSIIQEIAFTSSNTRLRNKVPSQIQLIYAIKKSENISLLHSISHLVLNQISDSIQVKLRVYVTQEKMGSSTLRELLTEFSAQQTILFDTKSSIYSLRPENPSIKAAIVGFSSSIFFLSVCLCNNFVFPSKNKSSHDHKTPSTIVDLSLFCSFLIAIACGSVIAVAFRLKNARKSVVSSFDTGEKCVGLRSMEDIISIHKEHEIHYGERPMFTGLVSKMEGEYEGSNVGVVVCGPESMKDSVALALKTTTKKRQSEFVFHPLNFTL